MADAKLTALTAASALAGADLFYISQGGVSKKATHTQLLTLVGTTYVPLAGGTMTGALTIASGTLTASAPALSVTQTWNNAGVAFHAFDVSITSTGSTLASTLQRWIVGGTEMVSIQKDGIGSFRGGISAGQHPAQATTANYYNFGVRVTSAGSYEWTSGSATASADLFLYRDAAATLAQRNGTNAQTFKVYGTTDAGLTNYERLAISAQQGVGFTIGAETLGTGADNLNLVLGATGTGSIQFNLNGSNSAYFDYFGNLVLKALYSTSLYLPSSALAGWTSGNLGASIDTAFMRNAAGVVEVNNGTAGTWRDLKLRNLIQTEYSQLTEMTAPAAPAANSVRIYAEDNGSGKTRLMALFATGSAVQIAIEP